MEFRQAKLEDLPKLKKVYRDRSQMAAAFCSGHQ